MQTKYINHYSRMVNSAWDRRTFVRNWWRLYVEDPRWAPPFFPTAKWAMNVDAHPHLARMSAFQLYLDALPRRVTSSHSAAQNPGTFMGVAMEEPVALATVLVDPRRLDGAAYLAELRCVNDRESLARLMQPVVEELGHTGVHKVIAPTGLSPYLHTGALQDHFDLFPPVHTAYNPPYFPELMNLVFRPVGRSQLYRVDTAHAARSAVHEASGSVEITDFDPSRLTDELLPLFVAACLGWADFPEPDTLEADFILRWVHQWPVVARLAQVNGQPVGFTMLQPDLAPQSFRAKGGRNPFWRGWLLWRQTRPVDRGRIVFGAVWPERQGEGIGRMLWEDALGIARQKGWRTLSVGPIPTSSRSGQILKKWGATTQQTYMLHRMEF